MKPGFLPRLEFALAFELFVSVPLSTSHPCFRCPLFRLSRIEQILRGDRCAVVHASQRQMQLSSTEITGQLQQPSLFVERLPRQDVRLGDEYLTCLRRLVSTRLAELPTWPPIRTSRRQPTKPMSSVAWDTIPSSYDRHRLGKLFSR